VYSRTVNEAVVVPTENTPVTTDLWLIRLMGMWSCMKKDMALHFVEKFER
jgi:hypothetical protein